jgi:hypothetical protein
MPKSLKPHSGDGGMKAKATTSCSESSKTHPTASSSSKVNSASRTLKQMHNGDGAKKSQIYHEISRKRHIALLPDESAAANPRAELLAMEQWQAQSIQEELWNCIRRVYTNYHQETRETPGTASTARTYGDDWSIAATLGNEAGRGTSLDLKYWKM